MEQVKRILDALQGGVAEAASFTTRGCVSLAEAFFPFHTEWKDSPDLLAQLHEAIGSMDLLLAAALPDDQLDDLLIPLSKLILAAHLHRQAGAPERAAATTGRALVELRLLVAGDRLNTSREHDEKVRPPYVWEMIGDACVCTNPEEARFAYHKAETLFRRLDRLEEYAEAAEIFPGNYHSLQEWHFFPKAPLRFNDQSTIRLRYKRSKWLSD